MTKSATRIIFSVLIFGICIAAYGYYKESLKAENERLSRIVQAKFEGVPIPSESIFIYQELEISRACKTAKITKLYSSNVAPFDICELIHLPFRSEGWLSSSGCSVQTHPYKRSPSDGNRPTYTSSGFTAGEPSKKFVIGVNVQPKEAWESLFMLSTFGEQEAVPLARKAGKTFFTVYIYHGEDRALFEQRCPENLPRCDCKTSLFASKYADGRENSRSE